MRALALFLLLAVPARADQIDYLMQFTSAAQAQADAVAGGFYDPASGQWSGASVIPGVQILHNTGTQQVTDPDTGQTTTQIVWVPITGYWVLVSVPGRNAVIEGSGKTKLGLDRDLANTGAPAAQWVLINATGLTLANIAANYCITPLFLGAAYPVGCK